MASTAWIGSGEHYPGNIVPGFEQEVVLGTGVLSGNGTLSGAGARIGGDTPRLSGNGTLDSLGIKLGIGDGLLSGGGVLTASGAGDPYAFTSLIGSPASNPGNIVPGLGGASLVLTTPSSAGGDLYRIQVFDFGVDFGIGELLAEFDRIHAIGFADYLNNVPEAFFSLHQDDPRILTLRNRGGRAHVRILRYGEIVWTGWASLERDANPSDAIFYCYGYLAGLYWSHTDWQQEFENASVGSIVAEMWFRAQSGLSNSRLAFVGTGSIQNPPTTAGGSTEIILPIYEAYRKRILFLMQEMAAIGASDTGNSTVFQITHAVLPTFNFFTNRRQDLNRVAWTWGDGRVQSFRDYGMPVYHRNVIHAVGQQPRNLLLQHTEQNAPDMAEWGRMEESLFLAWVRDEDELERVTKLRAAKALRDEVNLVLTFFPGAEPPPGATQSRFVLGDTAIVRIDRGVTDIDTRMQITGFMTVAMGGREQTRVLLQEPV